MAKWTTVNWSALMKHYAKRTQGGLPKTVQAHEVLNDTVLKAMNVSRNTCNDDR